MVVKMFIGWQSGLKTTPLMDQMMFGVTAEEAWRTCRPGEIQHETGTRVEPVFP